MAVGRRRCGTARLLRRTGTRALTHSRPWRIWRRARPKPIGWRITRRGKWAPPGTTTESPTTESGLTPRTLKRTSRCSIAVARNLCTPAFAEVTKSAKARTATPNKAAARLVRYRTEAPPPGLREHPPRSTPKGSQNDSVALSAVALRARLAQWGSLSAGKCALLRLRTSYRAVSADISSPAQGLDVSTNHFSDLKLRPQRTRAEGCAVSLGFFRGK